VQHKAGYDHVGFFRNGINYNGDKYFSSANSRTEAKVFTNTGNDDDTFTILYSFTDAPQLLVSTDMIKEILWPHPTDPTIQQEPLDIS
jgi:hypothetical protein